jgi:broad specificity phosphatase PhoE
LLRDSRDDLETTVTGPIDHGPKSDPSYRDAHVASMRRPADVSTLSQRQALKKGMRSVNGELPIVCLARHGETAWSLSGQHTGLTDLPLTERGEADARCFAPRLTGFAFSAVFTSPLKRAVQTCELAGFGDRSKIDSDLVEWNYGQYEGVRTAEIREQRPNWQLFRDGCPGGESPDQISARANRIVARVRSIDGNVLLFSSGHFLRVLAARWLGLDASDGAFFVVGTASLSILGYEHDLSEPAIRLWNDMAHLQHQSTP